MSSDSPPSHGLPQMGRIRFVQGLVVGGVVAGFGGIPQRAWSAPGNPNVLSGTEFDLSIGETPMNFTGRVRPAITVNGSLPAPILRWRQGSTVNLRASNQLPAGSIHSHLTSIHWHGIILPPNMDGVPAMSFNGIHRRSMTFVAFRSAAESRPVRICAWCSKVPSHVIGSPCPKLGAEFARFATVRRTGLSASSTWSKVRRMFTCCMRSRKSRSGLRRWTWRRARLVTN